MSWVAVDNAYGTYQATISGRIYRAQRTYNDVVSVWTGGVKIGSAETLSGAWEKAQAHAAVMERNEITVRDDAGMDTHTSALDENLKALEPEAQKLVMGHNAFESNVAFSIAISLRIADAVTEYNAHAIRK
jgi:hypothetical protein